MAGPKQPIELVLAKGNKHLTKEEIESRRAKEVQPCTDGITPPTYLTAAQKRTFRKLAEQLMKIKIMGETDVDALARYVTAQSLYEATSKQLNEAMANSDDIFEIDQLSKIQDRYCKQAHTLAGALGLTISSRCKLEVPEPPKREKPNKFERFERKENA